MKWIKKYCLKILSLAAIVFLSVYVCCFGFKKAMNHKVLQGIEKPQSIFTVWHVETFEGGGKARIEYLKTISRAMEKQDPSVLFIIRNIDPRNLEAELSNSQPDILSFGFGVGKVVLPYLSHFDSSFDVRDELVESGSFNNKLFAVPYIVSGYALFNHSAQSNEFHVGTTNYTHPEKIYSNLNLQPTENESQYDAYKDFVYDKKVQLLGTTRDLFRVNNLNNIGRANAMISPVDTYTDLIQYIGITNANATSKKFVEMALSDTHQMNLVDYSLFSSKYNKLYHTGIYNDMEDAIYSCCIPKVFA